MSTVTLEIAAKIAANNGFFKDDPAVYKIVQYTTPEGNANNYGLTYDPHDTCYDSETQWIKNPKVFWQSTSVE